MAPVPASEGRRGGAALDVTAAFVGQEGFTALGPNVDALLVRPDGTTGRIRGRDALVLDPSPAGFDHEALRELAAEAREVGAAVIGIAPERGHEAAWDGLADLRLGPDAGALPFVAPFDPRVVNPVGFRQRPIGRFAATVTRPASESGLEALGDVRKAARGPVEVLGDIDVSRSDLPDGVTLVREPLDEGALARRLAEYRGVVDHPELHASPLARGAALARAAAAGAPIAALDDAAGLRELLGDALAGAIAAVDVRALSDVHARERTSVAVRRAALRDHSREGAWRRIGAALERPLAPSPSVSVLLATRRNDFLALAIEQVNRQTYEPRELVLVLHGEEFEDDAAERLGRDVEGPLTVVRASGESSLGEALNAGVAAASGDLIAKMDDDDWYARDHLWDLVLAHRYSGAELVGKAPEFIYLADIGITLRRFADEAEMPSTRIASGALLIPRDALTEAGGFAPVASREQIPLIEAVVGVGGAIHRTHGFGFLVNRHGEGHTWDPEIDYFLVQSELQIRGRAFEAAGVD